MTDLNEVVRKISFVSDTSGLDKAKSATDQLTAAQGKLVSATQNVAVVTDTHAKSAVSVAKSLDNVARSADPALKALTSLERFQRMLDAATKQGQPVKDEWAKTLQILKDKHIELTKATNDNAHSVGLNRSQMLESIHVAKSLADSIIAGQSPLRALAVEGGRIGQIFAEGNGSVGGTLKSMVGTVGRLATGWVGLGAAVATGAAIATIAVVRFQNQQDKLLTSLNGAGRFAGVTTGGLTSIANAAGARNPALGQGGATDLAATLAGTGNISAGLMPGIMDLAVPFAHGTGQNLAKAGEELAKAFADPGKGAEQLNEKLGFLDDTTQRHIASLVRQGDLLGAQQLLLGKASDATKKMADSTWTLALAWEKVSNAAGGAMNAIGSGLAGSATLEDRVKLNIATRDQFAGRPALTETSTENILQLRRGLMAPATASAGAAAADKATNDLSIAVGEAVAKAIPEATKTQELSDTLKLLTDALRNPDVLGKVTGGAGAVSSAASRVGIISANSDPMLRLQQDSALSIQSARAETLAEREIVEARRAELAILRESGDALRATAAAEAKRNELLAEAQHQIDDAVRSAGRDAQTAGMRPYQSALARAGFQVEDLNRTSGGGIGGSAISGTGGAAPSWAAGVNPDLVSRAERLLAAIPGLTIISGYRDTAKQAELYAQLSGTGHPVAPPGTSLHERGLALDLGGSPAQIAAARASAGQYGLSFPVPGDLNHMQLAPGAISNGGNPSGYSGVPAKYGASLTSAVNSQFVDAPLRAANDNLREQADLLKLQASAANTSKYALAGLEAEQKLVNQYMQAGVPITAALKAQLDDYGHRASEIAKAQDQLAQTIQNSDMIRSTAKDGLHTFVNDLVEGKNAATAFRDAMEQLGKKVMDAGLDRVVDMFLGKPGTPSLGVLGGGATGGAGGGLLGGLFHLFGFADGGIMSSRGPVSLRRYADGGIANSPQIAMYGEGSGPEAIIPLKGGAVPVRMQGGGSQGPTIVHGGDLHVHGSIDSASLPQVQAMMAEQTRQITASVQRNIGVMQGRYNSRWSSAA